jgi:hypothetical protein
MREARGRLLDLVFELGCALRLICDHILVIVGVVPLSTSHMIIRFTVIIVSHLLEGAPNELNLSVLILACIL